jgi:hypothetical protein
MPVRDKAAAETRPIAASYAENTLPIIQQIQASGATSLRQIATALTARGVRRRVWHVVGDAGAQPAVAGRKDEMTGA